MKINGYDYNDHDRRSSTSSRSLSGIFIFLAFVAVYIFVVIHAHNMQAKNMAGQERIKAESERVIDDPYDPDYWYQDVYFTSREEIKEYVTTMAENPPGTGIYFQVSKEFTKEDIKDIAKIDEFDGNVVVNSFAEWSTREDNGPEKKDGYISVNISYNYSDEKYVYDSIVNSKPLPEDRPELEEVKKVCESFHQEYIKDGMSDYEIEVAAHDYIVNNCKYAIDDMDGEYVHSSYGALVEHEAVCDGYSRAMALLLKLEGVDVKLVSGKAVDGTNTAGISDDGSHMWNQVYIMGSWYNLDVTWDDPISDEDILSHTYLNVNDDIFERNHEWDKEVAEECTSMDMNYYKKSGIYLENQEEFKNVVNNNIKAGKDKIECVVDNPDLSEDGLSFIFENEGVSGYSVGGENVGDYSFVILEIRRFE